MKLYKLKAKEDTTLIITMILTTNPQISLFLFFFDKVEACIGSSSHSLKINDIIPIMNNATTKYCALIK